MIPDFPQIIKIRLAPSKFYFVASWCCKVSAVSAKLRQPTGQRLSNVRTQQKKINLANLILILWGKSGIIKFEFKTILVSLRQTYYTFLLYLQNVSSLRLWMKKIWHEPVLKFKYKKKILCIICRRQNSYVIQG